VAAVSERPLCVNQRCRIPRRHGPACPGADCGGCLVAWAADGLRLCPVDLRRLAENAVKLATLHGELELVLRGNGQGGERTGKPGSASPPRDAVVWARAEIRQVLVGWCRVISEERGIGLPRDEVTAMGAYVAKHAEWLAAGEYADEVADELSTLAGRAWGLAYPTGTRHVEVGPCPLCAGTLTAVVRATDSALPSEVACDGEEPHRWSADRWKELDRLVMAKKRRAA
jgi:hypothetical protein